jgi:hypothetical protein
MSVAKYVPARAQDEAKQLEMGKYQWEAAQQHKQ